MTNFTTLRKILTTTLATVGALVTSASLATAALYNPATGEALGGNPVDSTAAKSGAVFASYFITLWRGIITVGGIILLVYFLWAAIEWITAGGDSGKVTKARDRLTQSTVGFIILVSTAIILAFIGRLFFGDTLNLFQLSIPEAGQVQNAVPQGVTGGRNPIQIR